MAASVPVPGASSSQAAKSETAEDEEGDETSLQSPSFCMTEHTDCSEESGDDLSFYDYDDDFSSSNSHDDDEDDYYTAQHQSLEDKSSEDDPAAIQFELAISFQGRKYTATRAFSTFVKLRNDLLRESGGGGDGGSNRRLRHHRNHKNSKSNLVEVGRSAKDTSGTSTSSSVPELPTVSPESAGYGGFPFTGFARSGFALLQATAKLYCPEMEKWLRQVVDAFPYSPSLSQFLWEPLASSSASWDTENNITEEAEEEEEEEEGVATEKSTGYVASKPPLHSNSKSRPSSSPRKTSRFTQSYSCGSLNSIEEVQNELDRSEEDEW